VVIRRGDDCTLANVVIDEGLTVTGGTFSVQNSLIRGGWKITGGTGADVQCGNDIHGGLRVSGTSGGLFVFGEEYTPCPGGTITGGVRFVGNDSVTLELEGYVVHGRLVDVGNVGEFNEIEGNIVYGSALCAYNRVAPFNDEGDPNSYAGRNRGCPS
jgi:hypothetical protein